MNAPVRINIHQLYQIVVIDKETEEPTAIFPAMPKKLVESVADGVRAAMAREPRKCWCTDLIVVPVEM